MERLKISDKLKMRIMAGSLGLTLFYTGFTLGRINFNNRDDKSNTNTNNDTSTYSAFDDVSNDETIVEEYIEGYVGQPAVIDPIEEFLLESESREQEKTFNVNNLVVIEIENNGKGELYILNDTYGSGDIYDEYHDYFKAWYNLHFYTKEHNNDYCEEYIHFYEKEALINYLNEEEENKISSNYGEVSTSELDEILSRIRLEHSEKLENDSYLKKLNN